jgi:hypothetical protein
MDTDYRPKGPEASFGCFAGERACPPEDCGGPSGYKRLLEILVDPRHREHKAMRAWAGRRFDPEKFDMEAVNRLLKPRSAPWGPTGPCGLRIT